MVYSEPETFLRRKQSEHDVMLGEVESESL